MVNKNSIWFLTLFVLILVLSVYYVTMPEELLLNNIGDSSSNVESTITEEVDLIESMKLQDESEMIKELDSLKLIMLDGKKSTNEKNEAFEKMKELNIKKTKEEELEKLINDEMKLESFIKINEDEIKIIIKKEEHDKQLANKIMRLVQSKYEKKMYITVEFK